MQYISRSLEKFVAQVTQECPVVLVTGPRQKAIEFMKSLTALCTYISALS